MVSRLLSSCIMHGGRELKIYIFKLRSIISNSKVFGTYKNCGNIIENQERQQSIGIKDID